MTIHSMKNAKDLATLRKAIEGQRLCPCGNTVLTERNAVLMQPSFCRDLLVCVKCYDAADVPRDVPGVIDGRSLAE